MNPNTGKLPGKPFGAVVTWTLHSKHNQEGPDGKPDSHAFDCVPMSAGKACWFAPEAYRRMGEIGESIGLKWGGRWKQKDCPHFEI